MRTGDDYRRCLKLGSSVRPIVKEIPKLLRCLRVNTLSRGRAFGRLVAVVDVDSFALGIR